MVEQLPQYLNPQIGFSTGEGVRFAFEYGHRNIGGLAIGLTMRVQLSYLFEFIIVDTAARRQLRGRSTATTSWSAATRSRSRFPDIGLGPLVSLSLDGIDVRDNQLRFRRHEGRRSSPRSPTARGAP